jgi:hypothetical protein
VVEAAVVAKIDNFKGEIPVGFIVVRDDGNNVGNLAKIV